MASGSTTFTKVSRNTLKTQELCHVLFLKNCQEVTLSEYFIMSPLSPDCEQMEHGSDRSDDILPRGCGQYPGAPGPAGEVREQDPDTYQDRPELQNA